MASSSSSSTTLFHFTLFLIIVAACFPSMSPVTAGRPLTSKAATLVARLEGESSTECWDSLFELQSCTGEVILFFLNGETYLGPACCGAIRNIENLCWPSMLGALGYTSQEGDILLGYCDGSNNSSPPSTNVTTAAIDLHA